MFVPTNLPVGHIIEAALQFCASTFHEAKTLAYKGIDDWLAANKGWELCPDRDIKVTTLGARFLVQKVA